MHKFFVLLLLFSLFEGPDKTTTLGPPLDVPLILSANFGEPRSGHFHSGLDFKTGGVTGLPVFAASEGYIYRIAVSPAGFGKAIYIRHANGLSTVYGHLSLFMPALEKYVRKQQYSERSFAVNLFPDSGQFRVSKGELIGYSGNTGSSMGPHLHYEVRRSSGEVPLNPLQFYDIEDNIRPVIQSVAVYPVRKESEVNGKRKKIILRVSGNNGQYTVHQNSPIKISGPVGFGLSAFDYLNNSWNKCGVRIINLRVDNKLVYSHAIDEFSFSETRYINSHIDYEEKVRNSTYIQKTFLEPNNKLSIYNHVVNNGIIEFEDKSIHKIEISVADFNDNFSTVSFMVRQDVAEEDPPVDTGGRMMPFGQKNEIRHHDIRLSFPVNCFYDTVYFDYRKAPSTKDNIYSDLHYVHNKYTPVHSGFTIAVKPSHEIDPSLVNKLCLVYIDEDNHDQLVFAGGRWKEGFIEETVRDLGIYALSLDTISPLISPVRFKNNSTLGNKSDLNIRISDDFSGIDSYEAFIDGSWALLEWDPKSSLLTYRPDEEYLRKGKKHSMELKVRDKKGNESVLNLDFFW